MLSSPWLGGIAAVVAAVGGSACAMSRTDQSQIRCTVEGADNLPPEIGGSAEICDAIVRAATPVLDDTAAAPSNVSVTVTVRSQYLISAAVSAGGVRIPEQKVGIVDRKLNSRAIEMLAQAVATQLGKLGNQTRGDSQ